MLSSEDLSFHGCGPEGPCRILFADGRARLDGARHTSNVRVGGCVACDYVAGGFTRGLPPQDQRIHVRGDT